MSKDRSDHIDIPLFSCCYQESIDDKTHYQSHLPSKILYQTRTTTDPKSDHKNTKNEKHNSSSNIIQITPDSPTNIKQALKNNEKLSIRNKKTRQLIKNQIQSPIVNDKKINKESHHHTKIIKKNFVKDQNLVQNLAIYDSDHVKHSQQQHQKNIKNQMSNNSSPQRGSGFVAIKAQKRSCIASIQNNSPTFKNQQYKKKISIQTQKLNQNPNQIALFSSGGERKVSENISKNTISSPSHNTSMIYQQKNQLIKTQINNPQIQINNFYSPRNKNINVPQIQDQKLLCNPINPENKKDFYRPFLSGNNQEIKRNHLKIIQQNVTESKQWKMQTPNSNILTIPSPTLIQSKIEKKTLDVNNPQSTNNLLKVPNSEKKRDPFKLPRKSDLQMLKSSCISETDGNNQQPQVEEQTPNYTIKVQTANGSNLQSEKQKQINFDTKICVNKSTLSRLGSSKMTSYQLKLAGLGSMTVNSFAESVNQSKINTKIDQSVVMQDFFNPAKTLFNKWGKKEKIDRSNDQSLNED